MPPYQVRGIAPAAGFTSTVEDLGRFASWQFRVLAGEGDAGAVADGGAHLFAEHRRAFPGVALVEGDLFGGVASGLAYSK